MSVARKAWLDAVAGALDARAIVVAGLGANARYLPHLPLEGPHFALCDAMGAAIPVALGMALARPDRRVVALEGDGSLLMNLGILATLGATRPDNLTVLLFDNRRYEASGGQALPGVEVDFVAMARAAGIAVAARLEEPGALAAVLARNAGPAFHLLPTRFDPAEGIPPYSERPDEIRLDFARRLAAR